MKAKLPHLLLAAVGIAYAFSASANPCRIIPDAKAASLVKADFLGILGDNRPLRQELGTLKPAFILERVERDSDKAISVYFTAKGKAKRKRFIGNYLCESEGIEYLARQ